MKARHQWVIVGAFAAACGGETEPAKAPPLPAAEREEVSDPSWQTGAPKAAAPEEPVQAPEPVAERKEPEFKEGMSVSEAIAAVPSDWEYIGIEPDVLAKPLLDPDLYAPCNLAKAHKFKLRLAVWDGKVVGADVSSPNQKLADCIEQQVRKLEYKEQVKSMNTIDYEY